MNGLHNRTRLGFDLYRMVREFQQKVVKEWRGGPPVGEILVMPLSLEYETTNIGRSMILFEQIQLASIITLV